MGHVGEVLGFGSLHRQSGEVFAAWKGTTTVLAAPQRGRQARRHDAAAVGFRLWERAGGAWTASGLNS
jgi:hypothetical protein